MLNQGGKPMTKPDSKGFTLIEVMIAMAIFAIGILGATKLQITATDGNTTSRTMSEATTVVIDNIEKLIINNSYDKVEIINTEPVNVSAAENAAYDTTYEVTTEPTPILEDIQILNDSEAWESIKVTKIETTVKWKDRTFTITTYKAN
ncbi:MAG: prepilin-type N-terminal cleavage/methylation domain-containing protein [Desulfamplus sp.]|nr:prepilin-type N-terminal cleavage/methylation domain-containing protein [Desulfamplus sp.]